MPTQGPTPTPWILMKTCETCAFYDGHRCKPLRNPHVPASTKWLIVEHFDARAEEKEEDCRVWAPVGGTEEAAGE